jgi:hypothetical protein
MSIKIMAMIWDGGPKGSTLRFVLIALADNANDDGECWPSVATISRKTGICERAVRTALRQLESDGWLSTAVNGGRGGANKYTINPAPHAPGIKCPTAPHAPPPRHDVPPTPAPHAPEPSLNRQLEPSVIYKGDPVKDVLTAWASEKAALSFIAYRKKSKGKALTETAAKRLAETLKAIFQAGADPDDALGMAEERGWLTVKADWYFKEKGQQNGNRTSNPTGRYQNGGANGPGPSLAGIVFGRQFNVRDQHEGEV